MGPILVQYTHWPKGSDGNGDWLGFWGSYLGMIPSGLIVYMVASYQIKSQRDDTQYMEYTAKRVSFHIDIVKKANGKKYLLVENMSNCNANFVQILLNVRIKSKKDHELYIGMVEASENKTCWDSCNGQFRKLSLVGKNYVKIEEDCDESKIMIPIYFDHLDNINIYYQSELRETVKITYLVSDDDKIKFVDGYKRKYIKKIRNKMLNDKRSRNDNNLSLLNCPKALTYMERKPRNEARHNWVFENVYSYNGFREKLK